MNITFGKVTKPSIKNATTKNNTCVLALIMFHETIQSKTKEYFIVLSCVIYTVICRSVCIDYLACQSKTFSEICVDGKYLVICLNEFLGIVISYLLINLLSFYGSTKNKTFIVILNFQKDVGILFFKRIFYFGTQFK